MLGEFERGDCLPEQYPGESVPIIGDPGARPLVRVPKSVLNDSAAAQIAGEDACIHWVVFGTKRVGYLRGARGSRAGQSDHTRAACATYRCAKPLRRGETNPDFGITHTIPRSQKIADDPT